MAWDVISKDTNSLLASADINQLQLNFAALAAQDSGAPTLTPSTMVVTGTSSINNLNIAGTAYSNNITFTNTFALYDDATPVFWVKGSFIGVGQTNPSAEMHLKNSNSTGPSIILEEGEGQIWSIFAHSVAGSLGPAGSVLIRDSTIGATRFWVDTSGIMATPAVYNHDMNGETIRAAYINSTGEWGYTSSTLRKKINVSSMEDTSWIHDLWLVNFEYKRKENDTYINSGTGFKEYGLIAEQVAQVNSHFVFYDVVSGDNLIEEGVHYERLIAPMLNEIQRLNKRLIDLEQAVSLLT